MQATAVKKGSPNLTAPRRTATVQPKLMVNAPGDRYEQEADAMADQVMRMPQNQPTTPVRPAATGMIARSIQRKCAACEAGGKTCSSCAEEENKKKLMRKAEGGGGGFAASPGLVSQLGATRGGGAPLPSGTRSFMENAFSADFSGVRVHTDGRAAEMSRSIQAKAFTYGSDIYFNAGEFAPESEGGKRLLAHELGHVVQQGNYSNHGYTIQRVTDESLEFRYESTSDQATTQDNSGGCRQLNYNPCSVSEFLLSNSELIDFTQQVEDYLKNTGKGECSYYDVGNLKRRLFKERSRRIEMGHGWLADYITEKPTNRLYRIEQGAGISMLVLQAQPDEVLSSMGSSSKGYFVSDKQFHEMLDKWDIPQMDPEVWFRREYSGEMIPLRLVIPPPKISSYNLFNPLCLTNCHASDFLWGGNSLFGGNTLFQNQGNPFLSNGLVWPGDQTFYGNQFGAQASVSGMSGTRAYQNLADLRAMDAFGRPVYSSDVNFNKARSVSGAETQWRGIFPEVYSSNGSAIQVVLNQDLNKVSANFPVFDFHERFSGRLVSVTSSLSQNSINHYDIKFRRAIGALQPAKYQLAVDTLNLHNQTGLDTVAASQRAYLKVNEDHVQPFRDHLLTEVQSKPQNYLMLLDSFLQSRSVQVRNTNINSWNSLQAARLNGHIDEVEYRNILNSLGQEAGARVISNGITTQSLRNLQTMRATYQNIPKAEFQRMASPDLIEATRYAHPDSIALGDASTGFHGMAKQNAFRGAGTSVGVSAVFSIGDILANPENHPYPIRELAINLALTASVEGGGAYLQSYLDASMSQAFLKRASANLAAGESAAFVSRFAFAGRGLTSTGFGGVTSAAVMLGAMGIEDVFFDADYSKIDYAAKGGRAFVSGAAGAVGATAGAAGGSWLAASLTGAAAGTEFPVVGNVAGFIVGALVYWAVDSSAGESVEEEIREGMGEYGCVGYTFPSAPNIFGDGTIVPDIPPGLPSNVG